MTCTRLSGRGFKGIFCTTPDFKPGDLPPEGYLAWHEWAEVQRKAGIKQVQCGKCGLWRTPQELSGQTMKWTAQSRKGPVEQTAPVCSKCAAPNAGVTGA
jgi:ribosomal protein S27AE